MKPHAILLLLPFLSFAQESDFKEVKDPEEVREVEPRKEEGPFRKEIPPRKDERPARKDEVRLPPTDYQVRNIGKSDPRFAAIHKEVAAAYPDVTLDSLYSRLLAGETFRIERSLKPISCKGCNGFGKVPDKGSGYRSKDGKLPCPACKGTGKVDCSQVIFVKW